MVERSILLFLLSAISICYEMLVARTIVHLTDDTVLWKSVTIAFYIIGLGFGTLRATRLPSEDLLHNRRIIQVEWALSVMGAAAVPLLLFGHVLYRIYVQPFDQYLEPAPLRGLYLYCLLAQTITFLLGYLSGHELPLIDRCLANNHEPRMGDQRTVSGVQRLASWLIIMNLGTLVGTLFYGIFLENRASLVASGALLGGLNGLVGLWLFVRSRQGNSVGMHVRHHLRGVAGLSLAIVPVLLAMLLASVSNQIQQFHARNHYYNILAWRMGLEDQKIELTGPVRPAGGLTDFLAAKPEVEQTATRYQLLEWVPDDGTINTERLYINRHFQFSTNGEADYHRTLAFGPIALHEVLPSKILVLGGGDGLLVRDLLQTRSFGLRSIKLVELDAEMLALARSHPRISQINRKSLDDPLVETVVADAFSHVRSSQEFWDAVYLDFPYPYSSDLYKLYSREFYVQVNRHLRPGGFLALDFPLDESQAPDAHSLGTIICSTLRSAGFTEIQPFLSREESFVTARKSGEMPPGSARSDDGQVLPEGLPAGFTELADRLGLVYSPRTCGYDERAVNRVFRPTLFQIRDPSL